MSRIGPSSSCPAQKLQVAMLRGSPAQRGGIHLARGYQVLDVVDPLEPRPLAILEHETDAAVGGIELLGAAPRVPLRLELGDRKSTRLNSSHDQISYAVFCLKK